MSQFLQGGKNGRFASPFLGPRGPLGTPSFVRSFFRSFVRSFVRSPIRASLALLEAELALFKDWEEICHI